MSNNLFTTNEVAEKLKCSTRLIYKLRNNGELSFVKVGRAVRFTEKMIEEYLQKKTIERVL